MKGTRITITCDVPYVPESHAVTGIGDRLRDFAAAHGRAEIVSEEEIDYDDSDDDE